MEIYDLKVHQGETFNQTLIFKKNGVPVDLTGYIAYSQVRPEPGSTELICTMTVTITAEEGKAVMTIPKETTKDLQPGCYAYDLCMDDPDGVRTYYLGGKFAVLPSVTEE